MTKVDRRIEIAEPEDCSEGQMADFIAAEEMQVYDNWEYGLVEYECFQCGAIIQLQKEELENYPNLIRSWHKKAGRGSDYFSRFVFEYLAFIAYLKVFSIRQPRTDREAVQLLKQNISMKEAYYRKIQQSRSLRENWDAIMRELRKFPIHNSSRDYDNPELDRWWNCSELNIPQNSNNSQEMGIVFNLDDWPNMIEFWYAVRNNLFHGGKNPNIARDLFCVEKSFRTMRELVSIFLKEESLK